MTWTHEPICLDWQASSFKTPHHAHLCNFDSTTMAALVPNTIPIRAFENHGDRVVAVAVLKPCYGYDERMVTGSYDGMLRLWDLKTGVMLKKMEGHRSRVRALAVSRDGQWIASGDESGELIAWDGRTGELRQTINKAHDGWIFSLDFSSDSCEALASGSSDTTTKIWNTWNRFSLKEPQHSINCGGKVRCVRYSPVCEYLAITTDHDIRIYHGTYCNSWMMGGNYSLTWTPDGTRLFSGGNEADFTIREWSVLWNTSTWQQVGEPRKGHFKNIHAISVNSSGTLLASASHDNRVRLWRISDRQNIAIFKHSGEVNCVTFSADGKRILSGGADKKISEWPTSEDAFPEDGSKDGLMKEQATHQAQAYSVNVLAMNSTVRNACIAGDWPTAEKVLNLDIDADAKDHAAYANRAFVMARKCNWGQALQDAIQSVSIQPSLVGHISKGIALCGKKQVLAARIPFDLASMFTNRDLKTDHFLFLIKAIALFNANEHQEAMLRIRELAACPDVDLIVCHIVEAYLRVQLGNISLEGTRYNEAVEHFTAATNASTFFYKLPIHLTYDEFVVLFGWDLKSLWQIANQQLCYALFRAGSFGAAVELYQSIMDKIDEDMKADLHAWFAALE
ncbi:WD40 repeat-like protein [Suillus hirtellus]|nr:WD40 repeat-like protein [Suillus hirtellus]